MTPNLGDEPSRLKLHASGELTGVVAKMRECRDDDHERRAARQAGDVDVPSLITRLRS